MPHFVIECSENILQVKIPSEIMQAVYEIAEASNLFTKGDIKVRINPYKYYKLGDGKESFIHVFGNFMEGRTIEQKKNLSENIVGRLKTMFPDVPIISMNVVDFEKATYTNKGMLK